MGRDKITEFIVVRLSAVMHIDCDIPNVPRIFDNYADACTRMQARKREHHNSVWAVIPVAARSNA